MEYIDTLGEKTMKPDTDTQFFKMEILRIDSSQKELAEEFGVSKQTFSNWVTGRIAPTLNTALRIAKRLDCNVEDIWSYKAE